MYDYKEADQDMDAEEVWDDEKIDFFSGLPDLTAKQAKLAMGGKKLDPQTAIKRKQRKQKTKLETL